MRIFVSWEMTAPVASTSAVVIRKKVGTDGPA